MPRTKSKKMMGSDSSYRLNPNVKSKLGRKKASLEKGEIRISQMSEREVLLRSQSDEIESLMKASMSQGRMQETLNMYQNRPYEAKNYSRGSKPRSKKRKPFNKYNVAYEPNNRMPKGPVLADPPQMKVNISIGKDGVVRTNGDQLTPNTLRLIQD